MTVHIDQLNTEVQPTAPAPTGDGGPGPDMPWTAVERAASLARRIGELDARTTSQGFDD